LEEDVYGIDMALVMGLLLGKLSLLIGWRLLLLFSCFSTLDASLKTSFKVQRGCNWTTLEISSRSPAT